MYMPTTEVDLRNAGLLTMFVYIYGQPRYLSRYSKLSGIQFTRAELPLNFDISIGEQIRRFLKTTTVHVLYALDNYFRSLFATIAQDPFFDTLFLRFNIQNQLGGECYVFSNTDSKFIVFRGSDSPIDVCVDATIETIPFLIDGVLTDANVRVHAGFAQQLLNYNFIRQIAIAVDAKDGDHIHLYGHSLGAASALLQGYYLHHFLKKKAVDISIITLAGPVTGTSGWQSSFDSIFCNDGKRNFDRLINEHDIAPNFHTFVYDWALFTKHSVENMESGFISRYFNKYTFDYQHVGKETWIIVDGKLTKVVNAAHIFAKPTVYDVANIMQNHTIAYQDWLSGK